MGYCFLVPHITDKFLPVRKCINRFLNLSYPIVDSGTLLKPNIKSRTVPRTLNYN